MVRCGDMIRDFDSSGDAATAEPPADDLPVLPPPVDPPLAATSGAAPGLALPRQVTILAPPVTRPSPPVTSPASPDATADLTGSPRPNFYRDSEHRLHSSKVAFFDPLTGEVYCHVRKDGGLDLPGGHRDRGETSAAAALLRECLSEELRVPAALASRLRKYAKRTPYVQIVPRRSAVHVVSLWLVPATPAELAAIEQTEEGKREAHSPEMRPFATFQAATPYAEALSAGLRALNFRRDLNHFDEAEAMATNVATESTAQAPSARPLQTTVPDAAKYERGHWFYRLTFPSRKGSTTRWFPSTRYSPSELEEMASLRDQWTANLHLQDLPSSAIAAVIAAAASPFPSPAELTLNAHLLRCAHMEWGSTGTPQATPTSVAAC
jgi:8-oxo-dGTP pyrophosphatase MutT (NUDIX family)